MRSMPTSATGKCFGRLHYLGVEALHIRPSATEDTLTGQRHPGPVEIHGRPPACRLDSSSTWINPRNRLYNSIWPEKAFHELEVPTKLEQAATAFHFVRRRLVRARPFPKGKGGCEKPANLADSMVDNPIYRFANQDKHSVYCPNLDQIGVGACLGCEVLEPAFTAYTHQAYLPSYLTAHVVRGRIRPSVEPSSVRRPLITRGLPGGQTCQTTNTWKPPAFLFLCPSLSLSRLEGGAGRRVPWIHTSYLDPARAREREKESTGQGEGRAGRQTMIGPEQGEGEKKKRRFPAARPSDRVSHTYLSAGVWSGRQASKAGRQAGRQAGRHREDRWVGPALLPPPLRSTYLYLPTPTPSPLPPPMLLMLLPSHTHIPTCVRTRLK
ncbi:hypothetical protein F4780DRAFT_400461 [Xylariomycetidae sp. FL0641]|nr:hypothetical protein F4780DRAFT_400461 [Xylariomycetidae sp. FL0641]